MKILVLHTSALNLGYVGCYGSDWVDTPNLDRLAAEGVVFDRHFADRPEQHVLQGSHFTGRQRFPSPSGQETAFACPVLPDIVRAHGIKPLILEAADFTGPEVRRWARGNSAFCWVNCPSLAPPWNMPEEFLAPYFPSLDDEEPLLPWLDPPVGPFDDDGTDRERVQNTYAAQVSFFDAQLGMVLAHLE
jgi:arylsulfatase A-like enzyme